MLGCELWTENFDSMLALVKEYIIDLWEVRKVKLYGEPCSTQPQSQSSAGDSRDGTVVGGQRRGKFGKFSHSGRVTGKLSTCIADDSCKKLAPPTLGTWSMAGLLGQPLEYYYYYYCEMKIQGLKMLHETFGGLNTKTAHFPSLKAVVLRNHYFLLLCSNRLCRNSRVLLHESEFTCSPLG